MMETTNTAQTGMGDTLDKMIRTFQVSAHPPAYPLDPPTRIHHRALKAHTCLHPFGLSPPLFAYLVRAFATCCPLQDGKRLKGARNWCEVWSLQQPSLDPANGVLLAPGSMMFTLHVESYPGNIPKPGVVGPIHDHAAACSARERLEPARSDGGANAVSLIGVHGHAPVLWTGLMGTDLFVRLTRSVLPSRAHTRRHPRSSPTRRRPHCCCRAAAPGDMAPLLLQGLLILGRVKAAFARRTNPCTRELARACSS